MEAATIFETSVNFYQRMEYSWGLMQAGGVHNIQMDVVELHERALPLEPRRSGPQATPCTRMQLCKIRVFALSLFAGLGAYLLQRHSRSPRVNGFVQHLSTKTRGRTLSSSL